MDPGAAPAYYAASQMVVDPVLNDDAARARSPLKIVESMAMGVPVVTGDVGDRAEMLGGGRAGVLVEPGSAPALAEGIRCVLEDLDRHRWMSEEARRLSEQYRWDRLVDKFTAVYADRGT